MTDRPTDPLMTPAEAVRDAVQNDLLGRLAQSFSDVVGGEMDGRKVLDVDAFNAVWLTFWDEFEMPVPTSQAAEVMTPARLVLALVCPECGESTPATMRLDAVLTADASGRTLKVKGKSQAVDHVHGQTMMHLAGEDEAGTEGAFDIKDIVGDAEVTVETTTETTIEVVEDRDDLPAEGDGPHPFRVDRGGTSCIDCDKTLPEGRHFDPDDLETA